MQLGHQHFPLRHVSRTEIKYRTLTSRIASKANCLSFSAHEKMNQPPYESSVVRTSDLVRHEGRQSFILFPPRLCIIIERGSHTRLLTASQLPFC